MSQGSKVDWSKLGFEYIKTNGNVRHIYKNGEWGPLEVHQEDTITLHLAATVLHYGQAVFEGLKAFRTKDGKVQIFRPDMNAERLGKSAERLMMARVPNEMFVKAVIEAVRLNEEFVPPYETRGALYIRPFLIGSGVEIGLKPSTEYTFTVFVVPVGDYYKGDKKDKDVLDGVPAMVMDDFDRASSKGVGFAKVAGNYAAALLPNSIAYAAGCPITLFLDPVNRKFIEEFNSSNFAGINKEGTYITPDSPSILKSVTNNSLIAIAKHLGIKVEVKEIDFEKEIDTFVEVGAVGTAVIITPVNRIIRGKDVHEIGNGTFPVLQKLYNYLRGIQYGDNEDTFKWMVTLD